MRGLLFFFFLPLSLLAIPYEVRFIGLEDRAALSAVLESSELVSLQHRPPSSINGLRYRIAADIPNLIKVLHAYAYYEAQIISEIEELAEGVRVDLFIFPGAQFSLKSYEIYAGDCKQLFDLDPCGTFSEERLGIHVGEPALATGIVNAELNALSELAKCGYPLASIDKRRVEVDMADNSVKAASCVQSGPFARFGPVVYRGMQDINPRFVQRKISWKEGCMYDADLVAKTQERLLKTELFSSVLISHGDQLDERGELPLDIRLSEAKHKKVSLGVFYATVNGFGGNITWTHRNIRGMGEILSTRLEYAQYSYEGEILYKKPDFLSFDQTYRALAEVSREKINPYHAFMYRFANYIDRPLPPHLYVSFGMKMDHINVTASATNGTYFLLGIPAFVKYDRSDDPIDPKRGYIGAYSMTPYQSLLEGNVHFVKQRFTGTYYIPLFPNNKWILAIRTQFGSVAGTKRKNIPLPKLFLGGSEDDLRGYKYQTVSPLKGKKPLGGRSAFFGSLELRVRLMEKIGLVPFFDMGTVNLSELPTFDAKWFKSVGLGVRYFAFFGPLRFDVGFPLDRRKGIDARCQFYTSVGQAF
jgi:translocation and assembly module TamA